MRNKYKLAATIALLSNIAIGTNAAAVENGTSAIGDPRILPIFTDFNPYGSQSKFVQTCSGFLYSDRIVITAQHCTIDPKAGQEKNPKDLIVGAPGAKLNSASKDKFRAAMIYRMPDFKWYDVKTDLSFRNDAAVVVFDKPIAAVKPARLVDEIELTKLRDTKAKAWIGGYGLQSVEDRKLASSFSTPRTVDPAKAPAHFISQDELFAAADSLLARMNRSYYDRKLWAMAFESKATGTICDQDSGAGFFIENNGSTIYLGPLNGPLNIDNCQAQPMQALGSPVAGFYPTFLFQDLIDKAEKYVAGHPLKTSIVCAKGRTVKKITAVNPKCPSGYKLMKG